MKTLDLVLIIVAILLVAFITMMIITFWKLGAVPDTLITCVLGTGTAELICSALITIIKKKHNTED